jgi:8-oxo-dGTP pyrophosphatase MutT (NUDIX family)
MNIHELPWFYRFSLRYSQFMDPIQIPYLRDIDKELISEGDFNGFGVIALISNSQNEYLVHLRDDKDWIANPNLWAFIGGVVEDGEEPEYAILREVHEEVNLVAKSAKPIYRLVDIEGSRNQITVFEISADCEIGDLTLNEGQDFGFYSPSELLKMPLVPFARDLINIYFKSGI